MFKWLLFVLGTLLLAGCHRAPASRELRSSLMVLEYDGHLHSKVGLAEKGNRPLMTDFQASEFLQLKDRNIKDFTLVSARHRTFRDSIGSGQEIFLHGRYAHGDTVVDKFVQAKMYRAFPAMTVVRVVYKNAGRAALKVRGWTNGNYCLQTTDDSLPFWSFQAASYEERPDWVLPVKRGYFRENYQGMNASDYGGGTPVVDLWRRDGGLAVGHLATVPKLVSLPVRFDSSASGATLAVTMHVSRLLLPGDSLQTLPTFVSVHQGDFFPTLRNYSRFMQKQGIRFPAYPKTAYEPIWCAWGYERNFTVDEILHTLPKVKELGLKWVVLDDGWQTAEGDWFLNPKKFPRGDRDMRALTDKIHAAGLKAKLWIAPLAADPGTQLLREHPDMLLLNKNGTKRLITWWDSWYLCPAYAPTRAYFKKLITKILRDWNFDGLKLDGQHQNAVPPCYNPLHHHQRPEASVEAVPGFFKMIYETAVSIKPEAVVEICPCGDAASFFNMACENQPVASDPTSSWQIRLKAKTYKALMGETVPYYGDHVELSDGKDDFASTIGVGGVPGTKFTWPVGVHVNKESGDVSLTAEKEKKWKKWLRIYGEHDLPAGRYLGDLYDIGFDKPETHVIQKGDTLFYAFFARNFEGKVKFKGLPAQGKFNVYDYVNDVPMGQITGEKPELEIRFRRYLLVKVRRD
jgi:alpha-galactosidase